METLSPERVGMAATVGLRIAHELQAHRYCYIPGVAMQHACGISDAQVRAFAAYWDRLTLDRHMQDGGTYRFRRYSEFELHHPEGPLHVLPHGPYEQPLYINRLNGGVPRHFDPLEPGFVGLPLFEGLLRSLGHVFDVAQSRSGSWNIRVHPYRVYAEAGMSGKPTPEGLHRDGVDFIVTLFVRRQNVFGGRSDVTDAAGDLVFAHTLDTPMDLLVADDVATMHQVTPIERVDANQKGFRDVLVIAYTRT
jgi:hypothetical protein